MASSSKQKTTHIATYKPSRNRPTHPNVHQTVNSQVADRLAAVNDTIARLERELGRKSTSLNTLKAQVEDMAGITNDLVAKDEEKDRRLAFIERLVNDLNTNVEESNARMKEDSFKIWAEFDTVRGAGDSRADLSASTSTSDSRKAKKVNADGVELVGTIPKNDLHVSHLPHVYICVRYS